MRPKGLYRGTLSLVLGLAAGLAAFDGAGRLADPLEEAERALAEGRHWHAARILRRVEGRDRDPTTVLLAARADAGRLAWSQVVRRLEPRPWLDSIDAGSGRALLARAWLETGHHQRAVRDYRLYLDYAIQRAPRAHAEIGLARALVHLGRYREAATAYGRASTLLPQLEPWMAVRAAESLARLGDTVSVNRRLRRAEGIPTWRTASARAEARYRAGDRSAAAAILLDAAAEPGARGRAGPLRLRAGRIQLEDGDSVGAVSTLRQAIREGDDAALDAADLLSSLPGLTPADHLALARAYERADAPARAVPEYRAYLDGARIPRGQRQRYELTIGELLMNSGANAAALREFERLLQADPSPSIAARADYLAARALYRSGRREEGRQRLAGVATAYAGTNTALEAMALLADLHEYAGDIDRTREIYRTIAAHYPWSRSGARARFRLGILAFLDGDLGEAQRHFDTCRRSCRGDFARRQSAYWAGRSRLESEHGPARAEAESLFRTVYALDRFGYYGLLAAERLGLEPWSDLPPGPRPAVLDPETAARFERFHELRRAGLPEEANTVLAPILDAPPERAEELLALAHELARHGFGGEAVRLGWRAHARLRGEWSASVLKAIYPLPFADIIRAESRERDLDPVLLAAVARQESQFTPDAVSHAGARGLLQLMPQTARQWAGLTGLPDYRDELLDHPEINIHLGAAFLSHLQRRYRELQISLVAYNAGPSRARRWRNRPSYRADAELFVERIPFTETRNYVRGVQRHLRIYEHLYATELATVREAG